jgi:HSP20 family protein
MNRKKKDFCSIDVVLGGIITEERETSANMYSPATDIYENEEGVFIEMELPGIDGDDIQVAWENKKLLLKGQKCFDKKGENLKFYLLERPYGSFDKVIEIPLQINADPSAVVAKLRDGVLRVFIPYQSKKLLI